MRCVSGEILKPDRLTGKVGAASHDDRTIDAGVDNWRQRGDRTGVRNLPLEDAGRMDSIGNDLQADLVCCYLVEGGGVEGVSCHSEAMGVGGRDKVASVPIEDAVGDRGDGVGIPTAGRPVGARWIDGPVNVYFADMDRLAPRILDPFGGTFILESRAGLHRSRSGGRASLPE